jgi:hypothetical protein
MKRGCRIILWCIKLRGCAFRFPKVFAGEDGMSRSAREYFSKTTLVGFSAVRS